MLKLCVLVSQERFGRSSCSPY